MRSFKTFAKERSNNHSKTVVTQSYLTLVDNSYNADELKGPSCKLILQIDLTLSNPSRGKTPTNSNFLKENIRIYKVINKAEIINKVHA